jgi:5-methylcytosine-specific restriction endonuclease McrA
MNSLDQRVLVLNRNYDPIRIITAKNAICKLYTQAAEAIVADNDNFLSYDFDTWINLPISVFAEKEYHFIHTFTRAIPIPRVIRLLRYDKRPKFDVKLTRKNIYERDNYTCQYCGKQFPYNKLSLDHIVAKSAGGKNSFTNIVTSCLPCNRKKENKSLQEAHMILLSVPVKPNVPRFQTREITFQDWNKFISAEI